jgi:endoglucanase
MNFRRLHALTTIALAFVCSIGMVACSSQSKHEAVTAPDEDEASAANPVDYSKGRAMNKRLGKGINLGNSWDSDGKDDGGWGNSIKDEDFATIKATGFNSVRIPVRWQKNSDYTTHTVDPERLAGVKQDIELALANGLAVIVNFHHYNELNCAGGGAGANGKTCPFNSTEYEKEKDHFIKLWAQVAAELNSYPDSMLVLEILNEPTIASAERVNTLLNDAYEVIRANAKNKTIMFEAYHYAKFADLASLKLPQDGNIIFSGHYYEPYSFSHQGHSYTCKGDEAYSNNAATHLATYVKLAKELYPDVNGGHVPMNMGEFGISGGTDAANDNTCNAGESLPSAKMKAQWAKLTVQAAESNDMSWHYWGFTRVGGFEAYDRAGNTWYEGFPAAFGL